MIRTIVKSLVWLLALLVGIIVLVVLVAKAIPDDRYRRWLTGAVESATGRPFVVDQLSLDFGTTLRFDARGIALGDAPGNSRENMLEADTLGAEVRLLSLLRGLGEFSAHATGVDAWMETAEDGSSNWQLGGVEPEAEVEEETEDGVRLAVRPLVRSLTLDDATLHLLRPGKENTIRIDALAVTTPEGGSTTLSMNGALDASTMELSGDLGPLHEVIDRTNAPLTLSGNLADNTVAIDGNWGPLYPDSAATLHLDLAAPSLAALVALADVEIADPGALEVSADLATRDKVMALDALVARLEGDLLNANVEGAIENLIAFSGVQAEADVETAALNDVLTLFGVDLGRPLPTSASVKARVSGGLDALAVKDIVAELKDAGLMVTANGAIDDVIALRGARATLSANADSVAVLSPYAGITLPALGSLRLDGEVVSEGDVVRLDRVDAVLDGEDVDITLGGAIANLVAVDGIEARVEAGISQFSEQLIADLNATLADYDVTLPVERLPESVTLNANLDGNLQGLALRDLDGRVTSDGLAVSLAGGIEDVIKLAGVDIQVTANGPTAAILKRQTGLDLPDTGDLILSANLATAEPGYALSDLDGKLTGGIVDLALGGGIADLTGLSGIDASARIDADTLTDEERASLEALLAQYEVEAPLELLPALLTLEARVQGSREALALASLKGRAEDGDLVLTLDGKADNILTREGLAADANLAAESTAALSRYAQTEVPDLGRLDLDARVVASGESFTLEKLEGSLAGGDIQLNLDGGIDDLLTLKGMQAKLDAAVENLATLSAVAGTELPETLPITLEASIEETEDGGEHIVISAVTGGARLEVQTDLSSLKSPEQFAVNVDLTAKTLQDFQALLKNQMPDMGPLSLTGRFHADTAAREYALDNLAFALADQSAKGNLAVLLAGEEGGQTSIKGNLDIPFLDFTPTVVDPAMERIDAEAAEIEAQQAEAEAQAPATEEQSEEPQETVLVAPDADEEAAPTRMFSEDKLVLDGLQALNIDVGVNAGRLKFGETDIRDLRAILMLEDGVLRLSPLAGAVGDNGRIDGDILLDGKAATPKLDVNLVFDKMPMPITGGQLNLDVELDGAGATPAAIMGSLNGLLLVEIKDGQIPKSFVTRFGRGLLSLNDNRDYTDLECGILKVDFVDGVANFDDQLVVQLTETNWVGGGDIDFNTEALGIGVSPQPRKGIGISIGGQLASLIYVGGTLTNPSVRLNPKDVAVKYGKYLAYVSTGGLSLVAEALFNKMTAGRDLCAGIAEGTMFEHQEKRQSHATPPKNFKQ